MQFEDLLFLIERYRPLNGTNSLPFYQCDGQNSDIFWFTYFIDQNEDQLSFSVVKLYACSVGKDIKEIPLSLNVTVTLEEYDEPEADEEEYVQELEALTFSCTEEELFALLARAEMSPVLPVYKAVLQYMNAN